MTAEGPRSPDARTVPAQDLDRRIARATTRARVVGLLEVAWRRAMPVAWVVGLFVALSWLGVFAALPAVPRWGLLALLAGLLVAAIVAAARARGDFSAAFDRTAAIRRIEARSGLDGHELAGLADRLGAEAGPETRQLWAAHRARLAARIGRLSSGGPHPDLGRRDRWALRPLLGFLLFIGWFAADGEHLTRLADGFRGTVTPGVEDRLDAWIDPPAYTGRPPLVLIAEGRATASTAAGAADVAIEVPQGSRLVVRAASGRPDQPPRPIALTLTGADRRPVEVAPSETAPREPKAATAKPETVADGPIERVATLTGDVAAELSRDGRRFAEWKITVLADRAPTIRLLGAPEIQMSGAMKIAHQTEDDWGVASAEARFAPVGAPGGRPLYTPPSFPLTLPIGRAHTGRGQTIRDVTAHPFAGATMTMTLEARDEAGQVGVSEAVEVVLPQRPFRKPLARALVELRRRLALDADEASVVVTALDALMLAPDRFAVKPATHLGLRYAMRRAAAARSDDELREVVDLLWVAATSIEDGDLADHERALRDAQEALQKALESGASPEEIARLTRELRQAMEKFLAAKADQARRNPSRADQRSGPQKMLTERDLQRMLDRIENLARTGSREAAEKLLQEMREMLENLQAGPGEGSAEDQAAGEAMEKLGEMIRRQQKLMEETHRSSRGEDGAPTEGSEGMGRLGEDQSGLGETLRRFSEEMRRGRAPGGGQSGAGEGRGGEQGSGGDGSEDLDGAADAMGEAGRALKRGEGSEALDAQTRALEQLRRGARKLADRMMRQNGRGGRDGAEAGGEDPLGRPRRSRGASDGDRVKVPEEIDVERARRILDDIRKRLGEAGRPRFERDYLDRLLKLD